MLLLVIIIIIIIGFIQNVPSSQNDHTMNIKITHREWMFKRKNFLLFRANIFTLEILKYLHFSHPFSL